MPSKSAKPVFLAGTNKTYPSYSEAAKALGISVSSVSRVVSGKVQSVKGYRLGALSDRVIRVSETGQTFATPVQAARKLGVKAKKVSSLLSSGANQTTGGYHFEYDIAPRSTTQTTTQTGTTPSPSAAKPVKKNRKSNKQQRIKSRQQKKTAKAARAAEKAATRAADSQASEARRREREAAKKERYRKNEIARRTQKLKSLMEKINTQLGKYDERQMLDYSSPVQEIMEYMQYLNEDDSLNVFDTSDVNMEYIAENMTDFEIERWTEQLTNATNRNNGLFWDITKQEKERSFYAQELGVALAEIEEYAEFLPELWLIFREGAKMFEYDSIIWDKIKQSVKGGIPKQEFRKAMDKLKYYFTYGGKEQVLQDLLSDLDAYAPEPEITDDLPF